MVAIVVGVLVALAGLWLGNQGGQYATFGWLLVVLGVVSVVVNLAVRATTRARGPR